jgi:hypothetical protein
LPENLAIALGMFLISMPVLSPNYVNDNQNEIEAAFKVIGG